jgi:hypothetical protein
MLTNKYTAAPSAAVCGGLQQQSDADRYTFYHSAYQGGPTSPINIDNYVHSGLVDPEDSSLLYYSGLPNKVITAVSESKISLLMVWKIVTTTVYRIRVVQTLYATTNATTNTICAAETLEVAALCESPISEVRCVSETKKMYPSFVDADHEEAESEAEKVRGRRMKQPPKETAYRENEENVTSIRDCADAPTYFTWKYLIV